jgi:methyltransferase (TIGR00027 family)
VSVTAVGVAAIRAAEVNRTDALFNDPLADAFVRAAGRFPTPEPAGDGDAARGGAGDARIGAVILWVRVRTRFLDELLLDACANGCRQIVTLGAGLDTRAFRLALPGDARLFEVDLRDILAFKERVLAGEQPVAACQRIVVPTDLTGDWTRDLGDAGFDATQPTTWIAEGLLAYLSEQPREAVIDHVTRLSVPGARMGITLASAQRRPDRTPSASMPSRPGDYIALWQSDAPADVSVWSTRRAVDHRGYGQVSPRSIVSPVAARMSSRSRSRAWSRRPVSRATSRARVRYASRSPGSNVAR